MNSTLKHWKEAATVIIAARTGRNVRSAVDRLKTNEIPSSPNSTKSDLTLNPVFDYKVLLLKRSSKAGFMANAYVFPGGVVEPSDFSSDWLEIFKSFRKMPNFGLGLVKQAPETRPPIFATDRQKLGSPIPSAVALRICAVRETFEESGILLVVPRNEDNDIIDLMNHREGDNISTSLTCLNGHWDKRELARWRTLVTENTFNFIRMCRELNCLPNIWAMHEWGNWLTPKNTTQQRRYDTAFFICCLQDVPFTLQDEKEIVHFKWSTPSEALESFRARKHVLPMPQLYEFGRLTHFPLLHHLHSFSRVRAQEGCEQFLPVHLQCPDCVLTLLPGDDLYPENVDQSEERGVTLSSEKTCEQLQQESSSLHRGVFLSSYPATIHMNITPKYKHLLPIGAPSQTSLLRHQSQL